MAPDISLCPGFKCRKRRTCYRFTAPPDMVQAYAPFWKEPKPCSHYWPTVKRKKSTYGSGDRDKNLPLCETCGHYYGEKHCMVCDGHNQWVSKHG